MKRSRPNGDAEIRSSLASTMSHGTFMEQFVAHAKALVVGDPMNEKMGPGRAPRKRLRDLCKGHNTLPKALYDKEIGDTYTEARVTRERC